MCAAGTMGNASQLSSPACNGPCIEGHYCPEASTEPKVCPKGTVGGRLGLRNASECDSCPTGHWCNSGYANKCGTSFYTNASALERTTLNACLPCPNGATTRGNATPSVHGCLCAKSDADSHGFLTSPNMAAGARGMCEPCPANATCPELGTTLKSLSINDGFWRPGYKTTVASIQRCPYAEMYRTCVNGTTPDATYNRFSDATCSPGRGLAGAYCQLCLDPSHYFSQGECHACDDAATVASVLVPAAPVALIACFWWSRKAAIWRHVALLAPRSKIKIGIGFYQIITALSAVYSIDYYPPEYERLLSTFHVFNLHLFAWLPGLHPTCLSMPSLLRQLLFAVLAPLGVALAAALVVKLCRAPLASALPFTLYWSFLVYPSVSSRGFRALAPCDCFHYVGADSIQSCFLRTDYEELCHSEAISSAKNEGVVAAAWLAIVLYALGVPLLYMLLLFRRRAALDETLNFLTKDYEPHARWWELVEVAKKLTTTGFLALVDPGSLIQMYLAVTCSLLFLVLQLLMRPYRSKSNNLLAMISEVALAFTLLGTLGINASRYAPTPLAASNAIVAVLVVAALVVIVSAVLMLLFEVRASRVVRYAQWPTDMALMRQSVNELEDEERKRPLLAALDVLQETSGNGLEAAEKVFGHDGLHPFYWGVSKEQLVEFGQEVRAALNRGEIQGQPDPNKDFYYPQEKFDDPKIGPNMHQVNTWLIKPLTKDGTAKNPAFMPGLSYALMRNYATGGLRCDLYFSHAWDEGVFELIDNARAAWPKGCLGAYLCCLSNPQNLDIGRLLGGQLANSPFCRILRSGRVTDFVMLANSNTPIHGRLWCVLEAFYAVLEKIKNVSISGEPVQLLTGENKDVLRTEEEEAQSQRDEKANSLKTQLAQSLQDIELGNEVATQLRVDDQLESFREAAEKVAHAKLRVLRSPDGALIDLNNAKCTVDADADLIRGAIRGRETQIATLVVGLIKDVVCGVGEVPAEAALVPGSLKLSLYEADVDLSVKPILSSSSCLLQVARWMRLRPEVERLTVSAAQLADFGDFLRSALREACLPKLQHVEVVDAPPGVEDELRTLIEQGRPAREAAAQAATAPVIVQVTDASMVETKKLAWQGSSALLARLPRRRAPLAAADGEKLPPRERVEAAAL